MVETVLTPPHPHPFEALLDEPFAGTLHHSTPQRQAQFFILGIVDRLTMPFQIALPGAQGLPGSFRPPLHVQSIRQVGQNAVWIAMAQAVPGPAEPPTCLGGAAIEP